MVLFMCAQRRYDECFCSKYFGGKKKFDNVKVFFYIWLYSIIENELNPTVILH